MDQSNENQAREPAFPQPSPAAAEVGGRKPLLSGAYPVPQWLADRNLESWQEIISFYEDRLADGWASHRPILTFARKFAETPFARSFRAGQSLLPGGPDSDAPIFSRSYLAGQQLFHLIISVGAKCLEVGDPYLVVTLRPDMTPFEFGFGMTGTGQILDSAVCEEGEAIACLVPFLARLWGGGCRVLPAMPPEESSR